MVNSKVQNVLVADDHAFIRHSLTAILGQLGVVNVKTASNGAETHQKIAQNNSNFHLLFLDLNMPDEDGLVCLRRMKNIKNSPPIVLMSGEDKDVLESARTLAFKHGLNILGAIEKPITIRQVTELLSKVTEQPAPNKAYTKIILDSEEIERAFDNNLFTVYFQPQVRLATKQICGMEALVRIEHPHFGLLSPDSFIEVAEKTGQIVRLTEFVVDNALGWLKRWIEANHEITLSINLSAHILNDLEFPDYLIKVTKNYSLQPSSIICELTESLLTDNPDVLLDNMLRLRMMKFKLSIDDYGTGYASLEQLHRLPFQELKIDKFFVQDALTNKKSRLITSNSIRLGADLQLSTVAEGVENEEMLNLVKDFGCDIVQGYFISRPMPAESVHDWLSNTYNQLGII